MGQAGSLSLSLSLRANLGARRANKRTRAADLCSSAVNLITLADYVIAFANWLDIESECLACHRVRP